MQEKPFNLVIDQKKLQLLSINSKNLPQNKPTILFLHEGLGSIPQWKKFPFELCQKLNLPGIIYDRFGYGQSDSYQNKRTKNYLHYEAEQILPKIIKELGINQYFLLGHSDGGSIALIYGGLHQDSNLKSIISIAAHTMVEEITLASIKKASIDKTAKFIIEKLKKYHQDKTNDVFWSWSETWLSPDFKNWNIESILTHIECPVLAIQGENDEYGSIQQIESIEKNIKSKTTRSIMAHCGHSPHIQAKDQLIEIISNYLNPIIEDENFSTKSF